MTNATVANYYVVFDVYDHMDKVVAENAVLAWPSYAQNRPLNEMELRNLIKRLVRELHPGFQFRIRDIGLVADDEQPIALGAETMQPLRVICYRPLPAEPINVRD